MYKLVLVFFLAMAPMAASANIPSHGDAFSPEKGLDLRGSFEAQRSAIVTALGDGKTYSEISVQDRQRVTTSLNRLSNLFGDSQSVDELPMAARVQAFNEQELINTVLSRAHADSRMVCMREKRVGSHRTTTHCMTMAERRAEREFAQMQISTRQTDPAPQSE